MSAPIVSTASTTGAVAVSPHHLAGRAALEVMESGGNAVDGAVAANAVLGVVTPDTCGVGGDLFALVHLAGSTAPTALNASGRGGSRLDAAALRAAGREHMPKRRAESITVPGCVDGWVALGDRYGKLTLGEVLAPALRHAERGFQVSRELAASLVRLAPAIGSQPSAPELFPGGRIPAAGDVLRRRDYGAVLRGIAERGRDAFYRGPVAAAVAEATSGVVTTEDLAANAPEWIEPIGLDLFGHRAWTVPPNSQGYLTLAALWLFERLQPPPDPADPAFHHAVLESYRAVASEGAELVADPGHVPVPAGDLLEPARLEPRLGRIRMDRRTDWPAAGDAPGGTAYLCVMDREGMGVSLIQSNFFGIGSGISAGTTGIWLHNRGAGFSLEPGHPNEAAPGKRPRHTLAPTLWTRNGALSLLLGTRGGHQQPQYLAQVAALLHHAGLPPGQAQLVPRWHIDDAGEGDAVVRIERRAGPALVDGLIARGHDVSPGLEWAAGWGPVSIVEVSEGGVRRAAADPRVSTAAVVT